ncbi:hypothetical protein F5I97DRAFT_1846052 [Phlebopus sp. FC_14]|nr:hypothetical protein F5I97DRAFT_1846052 [Phlebopus sp. FC_14]
MSFPWFRLTLLSGCRASFRCVVAVRTNAGLDVMCPIRARVSTNRLFKSSDGCGICYYAWSVCLASFRPSVADSASDMYNF